MRLLHTGDLHLDLQTANSRPDPATGLPSRLLDTAKCWTFACEIAVERNVDAVLLAGDVFTNRNPSAAALTFFASGLRILEEHEIPVLAIPGNHDGANHPGQRCILEAFASDHFVVATRPEVVSVAGIRVACLPWVSRGALMAANPGVMRTDAQQQLMDALERVLDMLRVEKADVLTGHWSVQGAVLGGEVGLDLAITGDPALPPASLEGPWSFVGFGHIHRQQAIRSGTYELGGYCGSIDRMNFGEEDYSPSITLVDLEEHEAELIPTPARRFVTIDKDPGDALYFLAGNHADTGVEDAIVRVRLSVTEDEYSKLDREAIARQLYACGAHQVRIEVDVERTRRPRAEHIAEASGPLEALDQWLAAGEIPEDERADLRLAAKELVS